MPDLTWVLSSAVLILAVIAIRAAFGRRMRPGLRCALWALVLLRLLVPVQLFPAPWGVSAKLPERVAEQSIYILPVERTQHPTSAVVSSVPEGAALLEDLPDGRAQLTERNDETWTVPRDAEKRSVAEILQIVWRVGIGVTAAVFLVSNLRFAVRLRRRRKPLAVDCPLRVYAVEHLASSCLFGTAIYVAAETARDERRLRHVLAHELSHHRHGDQLWTLLRCVALALHWYHPLVWWAALLSRQDSELWADTGALRQLGEAERENYGETLIALSTGRSAKASLLCTATAMTHGKRSLKERVTMIARRPRMTAAVVAAVTLFAVLAAGCAFAGAGTEAKPEPDTEIQNTAEITQTSDDSLRPTEAELAEYGIIYDVASRTEVYSYPMDKLLLYVLGADGDYANAADEALYQAWNRATDHDAPTETFSQAIQALSPERAAWVRAHIAALRESHAKPFYGLMGLDGWYEEYQTAPHHTCRRYYVSVGDDRSIEIGCSFNFSVENYVVDLDGDGMTELVCNCVYGGDGAQQVYVYRRDGYRIERGSIDAAKLDLSGWDNWGVNSKGERYDPETGTITVEYASPSGGTVRAVGLDALAWEPYADLASSPAPDPSLETSAALPRYQYHGEDPYLPAVCAWLVGEWEQQGAFWQTAVTIPSPLIVEVDDADPQDIRIWGNFWCYSYQPRGTTLFCVSGGERPGLLHLRTADQGYEVFDAAFVRDGTNYGPDLLRIFGEARVLKLNGLDADAVRGQYIADYVLRNDLPFTQYQDFGWDPVPIPGAPETPESAQLVRLQDPAGWSLDYDLRAFSMNEYRDGFVGLSGVGDLQGISILLEQHPDSAADVVSELAAQMEQPEQTAAFLGAQQTPATLLRDGATRREVIQDTYVVPLPDGGCLTVTVRNTYYNMPGDRVVPGADAVLEKTLASFRLTEPAAAESPSGNGAALTEEALEAWREALFTFRLDDAGAVTSTPVSCFFTSTYADPRDLDLARFLAYCFPLEEPVEEEAEFESVVSGSFWEEFVNSEDGSTRKRTLSDMPVPVHRYRVSRINELLSQYAGITVDDLSTDWRQDGRTIYVPEYDAFYNFTSDFGPGVFEPRSGERSADIVTLRGDHTVLKLRVTDGGYHILSHLPIGAESTEDG